MSSTTCVGFILGIATIAITVIGGPRAHAQAADPNSAPNTYRAGENFGQMPADRKLGSAIGVEIDRDGKSLWVFDRCSANDCAGSNVAPIMKFDPSGKLLTSFGAGMFAFPHGLAVDRDGNVWATDGKRHIVVKFAPDGKVLMTLGHQDAPGDGNDSFNQPSDVVIAANGDIFVADGHGGKSNDRIVRLSKDGKFIKAWGHHGKAPGEFDTPHGIALDSAGRVFVADRVNSRVQVFDPDGNLVAEWKQFGRPSGIFIDKKDIVYVTDNQSDEKRNSGYKQGIRIGSAKDGKVTAMIPPDATLGAPEMATADDEGAVFGGFTDKKFAVKKFAKQ
jgi:DNA-binding beta-propeller fold protein YncE